MQKYTTDAQLAERYNVNRSTIWRWAHNGNLPQPVKLSPGCTRWNLDEIEQRDCERDGDETGQN